MMNNLSRAFAMIAAAYVNEALTFGVPMLAEDVAAAYDAANRAAFTCVALSGGSVPCAKTLSGWCAVVEVDGGLVTLHDHLEHTGATKQRPVTCAQCLQVFALSV